MIAHRFYIKYLTETGVTAEATPLKIIAARARARQYPPPINWLYPLIVWLVEWVFPLLLLKKIARASSLTSHDFDLFQSRLHHHRLCLFRVVYMLARLPLWDQLFVEQSMALAIAHPLSDKLATVAGDTSGFDVIVIGSGAGGAPLSWALSRKGLKVAVVESGGLAMPNTTDFVIHHYFLNQGFTVSVLGGFMPILAGNTVGGTTTINSGTCLRPPQERLAQWDSLAGTNFATGLLDRYFSEVEQQLGVAASDRKLLSPSDVLFEKGIQKLGGRPYILPRNAPGCQGSGRCCFVCPSRAKRSTDLAFLPAAVAAGCTLFANTRAMRIREEPNGIAVTVKNTLGNFVVRGRKLVIAAGAMQTPLLIRRNRLGSAWQQAGNCLKIHPAAKVFAYFEELVHSEHGVPQGLGYLPPEFPRLSLEGIFTPKSTMASMIAASGKRHRWWMEQCDHLASFGFMIRERAVGKVRSFAGWPVLWYRMTPEDLEDFREGLILCTRGFLAAGAKRVLLPIVGMQNEFERVEELEQFRTWQLKESQLIASGFHPQGTAGIGRLVDKNLAVFGTKHIYVCDASVLPDSPGVNPQITIMGLSLCLADHLAV